MLLSLQGDQTAGRPAGRAHIEMLKPSGSALHISYISAVLASAFSCWKKSHMSRECKLWLKEADVGEYRTDTCTETSQAHHATWITPSLFYFSYFNDGSRTYPLARSDSMLIMIAMCRQAGAGYANGTVIGSSLAIVPGLDTSFRPQHIG